MKKVLFVNFNCSWPCHFETELELMRKHIDDGDEVYSLYCDGALNKRCVSCYSNKHDCYHCRRKYNYAIKLIGIKEENCFKLRIISTPDFGFIDQFNSIEELYSAEYGGIQYTPLVLTNFLEVQKKRVDNIGQCRDKIIEMLEVYSLVFDNIQKIYKQVKPDIMCTFNGRFTEYAPVVNFCKANSVDFVLHERGSNKSRYNLWNNIAIHELSGLFDICNKAVDRVEKDAIQKDADKWYLARRGGVEQSWCTFTGKQLASKLPDSFDQEKNNIAIYNSSIWETLNFPSWQPLACFSNEVDVYSALAEHYKDTDYHFYLRIHPHLAEYLDSQQYKLLIDFQNESYSNFTVIGPNDSVDTYALMESSNITIVPSGSTIGIEACYWGKPVICLGKAGYMNDDVCYLPQSLQELFQLLDNRELAAKPRENSYKYGYAKENFGIDYQYYQPDSLFSGKFMGVDLQDDKTYPNKSIAQQVKSFVLKQKNSIKKRIH